MAKLTIDNTLLSSLLDDIAPLVSYATGWELQLHSLHSRVLPKEHGYEEILIGRFQHLGIQGWDEIMPDFLERMIEFLIEENTLAAYMSGAGEIVVIRENVDDSNMDGLRLILAHELVHRSQHMADGSIFSHLDNLLRQAIMEMQSDTTNILRVRLIFEQMQPIMTLLESHAAYIQGFLKQTYFPDARVETHFNIASLLMRLIGMPKIAQYTDGIPQVAAAAKSGNIESLYAGFGS